MLLSGNTIDWALLGLVLVGALMAHASVNAFNEYLDFTSGLDLVTQKTPFSGGSGTLPDNPHLATQARLIGISTLSVSALCGIYLAWQSGWGLLPFGALGIALILLYTGQINRHRYLVLVAPGLAFGPLMVLGTQYALSSEITTAGVMTSLVPFFLVNNLLLLNQIPDVQADRDAGRDNFVIAKGPQQSAMIYGGFAVAAYLSVLISSLWGLIPASALLGMSTAVLAYQVFAVTRNYSGDVETLLPSLGKNVAATLLTPVLVSAGIGVDVLFF